MRAITHVDGKVIGSSRRARPCAGVLADDDLGGGGLLEDA
jgi:hypothetical protein